MTMIIFFSIVTVVPLLQCYICCYSKITHYYFCYYIIITCNYGNNRVIMDHFYVLLL